MMIADDQKHEQPEVALVLGKDFRPTPVVNVDVSEEHLAKHISREKKTLLWLSVRVQIAVCGP